MKANKLVLVVSVFLLSACAPMVKTNFTKVYAPIHLEEVIVINVGDDIPFPYEELGTIKLGDGGITKKCGYDDLLLIAKKEATKVGGDAIKVVEDIPPHWERYGPGATYTNCHTLFVLVLKSK
jgi:hypothetical protein